MQQLLLAAALKDDGEARSAWHAVRPMLDLDRLEPGSFALTPMLYRRLEAWKLDDPLTSRLKGLYRHAWYSNQMLLADLQSIGTSLRTAGVDFLVGSGVLLIANVYPDPALRPTDRLDIVVRPADAVRAARVLQELGWRPLDAGPSDRRPSAWFGRGGNRFAVIRAPLFPESVRIWEDAKAIQCDAGEYLALSKAHQLLWTCIGDDRHQLWGRVQWVVDVHALVNDGGSHIDWQRVLADSAVLQSTLRLRDSLAYAASSTGVEYPQELLTSLDLAHVSRRERLGHRLSRLERPTMALKVARRIARLPRSL